MILQSRGCVDRGRDSTEHKPNLSPFTPLQPPQNVETQEEGKVAQMRVSVNTQRELKAGLWRGEKKEKWGGKSQEKEEQRGCCRSCGDIKDGRFSEERHAD